MSESQLAGLLIASTERTSQGEDKACYEQRPKRVVWMGLRSLKKDSLGIMEGFQAEKQKIRQDKTS